jgi:hypothetical protein
MRSRTTKAEDVCFLVGGDGFDALFHETWLWNGETVDPGRGHRASGRAEHALAYDSARSRVVLFGGRGE